MQDLRSMANGIGGGVGGRIFGGDRRLRPFPNQALKCPRCDSLNTKFCYYNNYNLSQPRHFCKSCRRYWTKGGVLRNVPVGGGCRKTKRSKPKSSSPDHPKEKKSTSHSSSESSSLTATTNNEAASSTSLLNFTDSGGGGGGGILVSHQPTTTTTTNTNTNDLNSTFETTIMQQLNTLDHHQAPSESGIFAESGSFTSLMTTASNPTGYLGFNLSDISPFRLHHHHHQQQEQELHQQQQHQLQEQQKMTSFVDELKMQFDDHKNDHLKLQELTKGFYDQTVPGEMPGLPNRTVFNGGGGGGELTALDWQSSSDHHQELMFDLPSTVDQSYWSQSSQWNDSDHPLYLP